MLAPAFVHAAHPDHGEPVVYTLGEFLPPWVAEALAAGRGQFVAEGVIELDVAAGRPQRESPRTGRRTKPRETT